MGTTKKRTEPTPPQTRAQSEDKPIIEGYEFLDRLGEGEMSSVWKARQLSLRRMVVIKVLPDHLSRNMRDLKQFMFEAQVAANLKHQGIVQVYDFGQSKVNGRYYFVMEYISGYTVGHWQRRKGRLSEADSLAVAQGVADALNHAWTQAKIIHCDIKPDNIMIDGDGTVKVTDLGLAQMVSNITPTPGEPVEVTGTPNYISPEQAKGRKDIDFRTDIYALGATLYHLTTGIMPFGDSEGVSAIERHARDHIEDPQKVNPVLSDPIVLLMRKMMAKNAEQRHASWDKVVDDILRVQKGKPPLSLLAESEESTMKCRDDLRAGKTTRERGSASKAVQDRKEELVPCPFCKELIRKNAVCCRHCGKDFEETARQSGAGVGTGKSGKPTEADSKDTKQPVFRPVKIRKPTSWGSHIRMAISLALLLFLAYYGYMKEFRNVDVLIPVRERLQPFMGPVWDRAQELVGNGWAEFKTELFRTKSDKPLVSTPPPEVKLKPKPAPVPVVAPVKQVEEEVEEETSEEEEEEVEEGPAAPVQPTQEELAAQEAERKKKEEEKEFESLVKLCEQEMPQAGQTVSIRLKGQDAPVEGVLEEMTKEGVTVKVKVGAIGYPFNRMTEESRIRFFPEELARLKFAKRQAAESGAASTIPERAPVVPAQPKPKPIQPKREQVPVDNGSTVIRNASQFNRTTTSNAASKSKSGSKSKTKPKTNTSLTNLFRNANSQGQ